jgi:deoxyribonuclease IV
MEGGATLRAMLIGAHVSAGGGLPKAVERGAASDSDAIQIFNQSSRAWRLQARSDHEVAAFYEAMDASRVEAIVIHAVYLINVASRDEVIRGKSLTALIDALRLGDRIGAAGVVLHPGAQAGADYEQCMQAIGEGIREVLAESDACPLLLEDTAGHTGTIGRDFDELARLVELGGSHERVGICLDCCHLFASGFDIQTPDALASVVDEFDGKVGLDRLRALHINDSKMPFGSNRDRHADIGKGELGRSGIRTFLSEPRFDGLPTLIETKAAAKEETGRKEVRLAKRLRREGLKKRGLEVAA